MRIHVSIIFNTHNLHILTFSKCLVCHQSKLQNFILSLTQIFNFVLDFIGRSLKVMLDISGKNVEFVIIFIVKKKKEVSIPIVYCDFTVLNFYPEAFFINLALCLPVFLLKRHHKREFTFVITHLYTNYWVST